VATPVHTCMSTNTDIVRSCYEAYTNGDRDALERVIAPDFHFWSPHDAGIDRDTYFARCWPPHVDMRSFRLVRLADLTDDEVLVTYELTNVDASVFRNTEILTLRAGQIVLVEVYFGWDVHA
jgi:ketosteroid isomerase-like protein